MREAWVVQGVKQLPSGQVLIPEGQDPAPPQTPCSVGGGGDRKSVG